MPRRPSDRGPARGTRRIPRSPGRTLDRGTARAPAARSRRPSAALYLGVAAIAITQPSTRSAGRPTRSPAGLSRSRTRPIEVGVALGLEPGVRVAHEVGPRASEHHLKVGRLEPDVLEPVDDAGRRRHAVPASEHGFFPAARAVLEENLHLAVEDEEH